ncbi:MAG: aminotransferase class III-fold pyridoxal phosphate-dependent enzyme [Synergistetes bacterium]|nr:aminotransferase class III-fold pyridoxal phosphate-dependent enzyme [Synergistota bacterium]MCX8127701.1 aminotransferase class III-fold pyridoxal phosphate-dependent enzyme [Synergistota bacterium]MDW8191384.1 aminotransferase class III-fold pyridoxal phosphate-dependent enzyme [Synergistota bacterium]
MRWEDVERYVSIKVSENLKQVKDSDEYIASASGLKYYPLCVERAEGAKVWDKDGNEYIDFLTSACVYNVGHRHPKVVAAIKDQVEKVLNYTIAYLYEEPPVKLAKKLAQITPGNFKKRVTFGFSGSDGVDSAIKAARAYTGRRKVIAFRDSYHGTTYGSLSLTGIVKPEVRGKVFPIPDVHFVEYPDPYRNIWNIDGYKDPKVLSSKALEEIESKIKELDGDVAAIVFEPMQGDAGVVIPPKEFIVGLRNLADKYGIVLVDEEVQTGIGRTGKWWAIENFDVVPDIIVTAKALGGGMPISATIGKEDIIESVPPPLFVFTHCGHAVNARAALATIEVVEEEGLLERANKLGKRALDEFNRMKDEFGFIGDVRGVAFLIGIDIVKDRDKKEADRNTALKICWRAWEKGLILVTFGKGGNVLRIAPPLTIKEEELERALDVIESSMRDVRDGKVSDEVLRFLRGW